MTGSGKSEFIITYILSMAVNYHPDEVAFILIDYKGGGLAGAFEDHDRGVKLPHLAGTITNLDGAAVKRSLISIQSELRRREMIFNEARRAANEATMDIYKYQQLYRDKVVSEPLPHLFIISDEFAELKTQQPVIYGTADQYCPDRAEFGGSFDFGHPKAKRGCGRSDLEQQ